MTHVAMWMSLASAALAASGLAAVPASKPAALAGESHQIASVSRDDLLRPRDASSADGTPIVVYPRQDWRCMTWKFEPAGEDAVRLINYFTHKTFSAEGRDDAAKVTQHAPTKEATDAQRWRFVPAGDGVYRIEQISGGKVLTVTADGDVVIDQWKQADSQKWKLLEKPVKFSG